MFRIITGNLSLTILKRNSMYFYTHKIYENEKNILLEMCNNACFHSWDVQCSYGIDAQIFLI